MQRLENISYEDIEVKSRKMHGLDGFDFVVDNDVYSNIVLITVFHSDTRLMGAVDNALYEMYGEED